MDLLGFQISKYKLLRVASTVQAVVAAVVLEADTAQARVHHRKTRGNFYNPRQLELQSSRPQSDSVSRVACNPQENEGISINGFNCTETALKILGQM
jgi:hypothetical protein